MTRLDPHRQKRRPIPFAAHIKVTQRRAGSPPCSLYRAAPPLFTLILFMFCRESWAQTAGRKSPEAIKADLDRILAASEFQINANTHEENGYTRFLKWLGKEWQKLMDWLGKMFRSIMPKSMPMRVGGGGGLQWVFIVLFLLLAAWLIYKLVKAYVATRKARAKPEHTVFDFDEVEEPIEREPDVWLRQAQTFADGGDYRRALRAVYAAVLMQLDRARIVGFNRSRTNGEYVRMLRRQSLPMLADVLGPLTDRFEPRWYGDVPATDSDYADAKAAYDAMQDAIAALAPVQNANKTDADDSNAETGGKTGGTSGKASGPKRKRIAPVPVKPTPQTEGAA